jgi:hypothetical protein
MAELKFRNELIGNKAAGMSSECSCSSSSVAEEERPRWTTGTVSAGKSLVYQISTDLTNSDLREHIRCRISAFRESYKVKPGLYAVGQPDKNSIVLVSANYKLSFDHLRKELKGMNAWVLVLDTKGINVWCAAGKGTFGTEELVKRITLARLPEVVDHRNIIVPQLGAPGVSAHRVRRAAGFKVLYGPVYAKDIPAYISAGCKATPEMREVRFTTTDRLVLTPMEINPAMKKYYPWYAIAILIFFGLQPTGIIFREAFTGGLPFLGLGLVSVFAGGFLTPLLLPWVPSRSFAVKGWLVGLISVLLTCTIFRFFDPSNKLLLCFTYLFFPMASSYIALQFTGSTTFTGMSGVRKELKISVPVYILSAAVSVVLLIVYKTGHWGTL